MKAGVIGAGAWGTALAQLLASDGQDVALWALEPDVVDAINAGHENPLYLANIPLSPSIRATGAMAVLVTAFSLFTDALRDALDPRLK